MIDTNDFNMFHDEFKKKNDLAVKIIDKLKELISDVDELDEPNSSLVLNSLLGAITCGKTYELAVHIHEFTKKLLLEEILKDKASTDIYLNDISIDSLKRNLN